MEIEAQNGEVNSKMSTLSYNGITLPFVNITQFEQMAKYDELSQTDWILTQFDITCHAVLNPNYFQIRVGGAANPVQNPAAIMGIIRSMLLKPRKKLSVQFNGVELIPQPQGGLVGTVDAKNGPQPQQCSIVQLSNTTFLIIYKITASYWENNSITGDGVSNQTGGWILYTRWSDSVDIDRNNFSKRTREGQFMIRSDNSGGWLADQLRTQTAVVGIPPGFLRERAHYQVTADGLTLRFRVEDIEVFKKPPSPAFHAEGSFIRTTPVMSSGGAWHTGSCQVRLEGSKSTTLSPTATLLQLSMMNTAVSVCYDKLNFMGLLPGTGFLTRAELKGGMYSNWVEVSMAGKWQAGTPDTVKANDFLNGLLVFTPVSDSPTGQQYVPEYSIRGTAGLLLEAAAYNDPNINNSVNITTIPQPGTFFFGDNKGVGNETQLSKGLQPGQAGKTLEN